ncbi:MAG: alpha/beta fold hydrolase [Lachnospiraceae bacterium]|nr:alpha/beta fold hydrolase [Lachnospiraceae bacterium]
MKKRIRITAIILAVVYFVIAPIVIAVIHGRVMSKCTYDEYDTERLLVYDDVAADYPRERFQVTSGDNNLSAYLYGKDNIKGLIVVSSGHRDANDVKLYEIMYFVDAGYQVICFDYTGCYTSEGNAFGKYTQAVYDLDAILTYCDSSEAFSDRPVYLFGHSLGGYATGAVLNYEHRVDAVVVASGFDCATEQWECSVKRFTDPVYFLIRPINLAFINKKDSVTNGKCEFVLMDQPGHNEHYDYFLTDNAVEYEKSELQGRIDKRLYMEHDENVMKMICDFYEQSS